MLTEAQRNFGLRQWQVLSTDAALSGGIMFFVGGSGEERTTPWGDNQHDAVGRNETDVASFLHGR